MQTNQSAATRIQVAIVFAMATVFDIGGVIEIDSDETFKLEIKNSVERFEWFANQDAVLDIEESADSLTAKVTSTKEGYSDIELQQNKVTVRIFKIKVRKAKAVRLEIIADKPTLQP